MKNLHVIEYVAVILLIVGGLNWGLIGLFKFNLIDAIFGMMSGISRIIYVLVGVAAAYRLVMWLRSKSAR